MGPGEFLIGRDGAVAAVIVGRSFGLSAGDGDNAFGFFQKWWAESGVLDPLKIAVAIIFVGDGFGDVGDGFVFAQDDVALYREAGAGDADAHAELRCAVAHGFFGEEPAAGAGFAV